MSTTATSPSPPDSGTLRATGSPDDGSLAPTPPTADFATDTGTTRATAVSEFQHGMTYSIGR